MTDAPRTEAATSRPPLGRGVMLLIGLLVGIVAAAAAGVFLLGIGIATVGEVDEVINAEPTTTEDETAPEAASTGEVPEVCVQAAEYSIAVDEGLDELARGAGEEDALILQEAFDAIQDARDDASGAAEECLELAGRTP